MVRSLMKDFGKIMQSSKSEWAIKYWGHIGEDDDQPWIIQDFFGQTRMNLSYQ